MKCTACKEKAVVSLPSHHAGFCEPCFLRFFTNQVEKGIRQHKLFTHNDKILVALSGGKDSLALMLELKALGYNITGLHIDLGIPNSSVQARSIVENFCQLHSLPLIIKELKDENLMIPFIKKRLNRPICSACGKIKRHFFNKIAIENGYDVLATGHNLDDEVARLTSNTLRWDKAYLSDQGPSLPAENGFSKKVKPLWRLSEFETANYAFLKKIDHHISTCPYSRGASFTKLKYFWFNLEEESPGRKIDFYQGFLERGRPAFQTDEQNTTKLTACTKCGYPTSVELCSICRIKELVNSEPNK
ncbi:TIGR00269 family protein [Desulfovibrio litoralis]|uniref:TIGR00269 family protein n=1 Tax=Desulfovibrio litoralis DSM 11393 TaxID=1121455 RepID=A0A1M7SM17_9BACT|nr:TIGR00269 family protein [Desulfovibrio litoralis]SHN59539.1 TIGR00269 family protein [Desulfovibrio litoralis DSM 11393]